MFLSVCELWIILRQGRNLQHRSGMRVLREFEISVVSEISELVKASWVSDAIVLFYRRPACVTWFVPMILAVFIWLMVLWTGLLYVALCYFLSPSCVSFLVYFNLVYSVFVLSCLNLFKCHLLCENVINNSMSLLNLPWGYRQVFFDLKYCLRVWLMYFSSVVTNVKNYIFQFGMNINSL
jgi:hypothetical protein